ncbi:hypothetical protein [Mucilaginibacter sp.]|uniref:anti-sigma factor family protein n=1 Tax=Mucilaginibacter sp. TaxID=1882438 RepID=UPI002625A8E3|nr:hypothetical protein [Mucilaginibacter sp.]MDB5032533.1 hypothetical protein [Mucilaginibacter sp.]
MSIEEKLWDYIDGACSVEEHEAIDLLLVQDEAFRQKYLELLALNREIAAMEIEEPSMAFTYKVMENIRADYAKKPLKVAIDSRIIKVIGGFFVLTIAALLLFILVNINWSASTTVALPAFKMPEMKSLLSGEVLKGFLFFDVVLVLFLFDAFLRKKGIAKHA